MDQKDDTAFYCLVVGSRYYTDYEAFRQKMDFLLSNHRDNVVLVSGGARGTDAMAERYAKERGIEIKVFQADWAKYGRTAGPRRNFAMHNFLADHKSRGCVAFWNGDPQSGTAQNFDFAEDFKTPLKVVRVNAPAVIAR